MEGSGNPDHSDTHPRWRIIDPTHQFLYLQVHCDLGTPLPPALFSKEVIFAILATQSWIGIASQPPLDGFLVSDTER